MIEPDQEMLEPNMVTVFTPSAIEKEKKDKREKVKVKEERWCDREKNVKRESKVKGYATRVCQNPVGKLPAGTKKLHRKNWKP